MILLIRIEEIVQRLNEEPDTTEGMDELEKFVVEVEGQLEAFEDKISYAQREYAALVKAQFLADEEADALFWDLCHWPLDLNHELTEVRTRLTKFRNR